ncbi:16S rRNA (guanine(527)-N(7))-methyltransferase RsmG [Alteromonas sp. ASW11-36]|uniref:Ribosomal RNA small subunit methyltransferase G n=1 Tax=Alteromonas arenosi TaxID=3055817 RepID=A0ABT7ST15_9ALTE|nr:16S rRNA (guanine(527)-N(7))-methyltransferase RsmG [Alteromonas sp. ASW11-36]MDM7859333.1 16S rRNA (guanine(527)-N(7))-methyltransferase RsmG [Alteromonas sp. ASW11-36]
MAMDLQNQLASGVAQLGLDLSNTQMNQLVAYVELMVKWNKAYNLTSVRDPNEMLNKHILDSLAVVPFIENKNYIDVGTGPGLPGIPLAIACPNAQFTCLDSLGKRVRFMKQVVFELGLSNVIPVQSRVEEHQISDHYDGVLSRAFASLQDMLQWCQHLINSSGEFLALKGQYPQDELTALPDNINLVSTHKLDIPFMVGERHLIRLKKQ